MHNQSAYTPPSNIHDQFSPWFCLCSSPFWFNGIPSFHEFSSYRLHVIILPIFSQNFLHNTFPMRSNVLLKTLAQHQRKRYLQICKYTFPHASQFFRICHDPLSMCCVLCLCLCVACLCVACLCVACLCVACLCVACYACGRCALWTLKCSHTRWWGAYKWMQYATKKSMTTALTL